MSAIKTTVPPALTPQPLNRFQSVRWAGDRTEVRAIGRQAEDGMPDYVAFSAGGNAIQASMCLTPADARLIAALLLQEADKAEARP